MKIVILGAGNLGYHLGKSLSEAGVTIAQVYSRTEATAKVLAQEIRVPYTNDIASIDFSADIFLMALSDSAIEEVARQLKVPSHKIVAHTSGATPGTVLKPFFKNYGVFYPLQTFSFSLPAHFRTVPICVDGANETTVRALGLLGRILSGKVQQINDEHRAILHIAAVFVNNFTNHLNFIGEQILEDAQLPFDLLKPLVQETILRLKDNDAFEMQTGPARRKDMPTIERHLTHLKYNPQYEAVYKLLTKSILETYK